MSKAAARQDSDARKRKCRTDKLPRRHRLQPHADGKKQHHHRAEGDKQTGVSNRSSRQAADEKNLIERDAEKRQENQRSPLTPFQAKARSSWPSEKGDEQNDGGSSHAKLGE